MSVPAGFRKALRFHWSLSQAGHPFRRAARPDEMSGHPRLEAQAQLCRCADEYGIDSVLMAIGFTRPDPLLLSACLAARSRRVKFLIACRPGLITPTAFVQQINTLSLLIDGRVHVNLVGGHTPAELRFYGDWSPREERYAQMDEFLTVCRAFWENRGEEVNFTGSYYRIEGGRLSTPFSTSGALRPEIYVGGNSAESAALAVRHADCLWRFAEPPETLAPAIAPVLRTGTEVGLLVSLVVRSTRAEAVRAAEELIAQCGGRARAAQEHFEQRADAAAFRSTFALARACSGGWLTETLWAGAVPFLGAPAIALVGSADAIADALLDYQAAGVTQFLFAGWPDADEMAFFGREVIPRVREREAAGAGVVEVSR